MCAENLENCSWILQVLITQLIPLITLPLPPYAWEPSALNVHPKNGGTVQEGCTRQMHAQDMGL